MISKPFFSIIIPTYNRADRLKIALSSLVDQTFKDFEVIVCDDGSTDDTQAIVDSFKKDLSIKYIWEENWGGPARPRNTGIKNSYGDWICLLDSDDFWYPKKLEVCLQYLENSDFIYHNFMVVSDPKPDKSQQFVCRQISNKNAYMDLLLNWNSIANSGVVVRKSILEKAGLFDENKDLVGVEDFDMWLRVSKLTNRFKFIPIILGGYYLSSVSLTKDIERCIIRDFLLLDKYKYDLSTVQFIQVTAVINLIGGIRYLANNHRKTANKYFHLTLVSKSSPFVKIKALVCLMLGNHAFQLSKLYNELLNVKLKLVNRKSNSRIQ